MLNAARPISQNYRMGSKTGDADILAADLAAQSQDASTGHMGLLEISLATAGVPAVIVNNGEGDEEKLVLNNGATLTGYGLFPFPLPVGKTLNFQTSVTGDVDILNVYVIPAEAAA